MKLLYRISLLSLMLPLLTQALCAMDLTKKRPYEESAADSDDLLETNTSKLNRIDPHTTTTTALPTQETTDNTTLQTHKRSPEDPLESPEALKRQHNDPLEESRSFSTTCVNFIKAIKANDTDSVKKLIERKPSLSNLLRSTGFSILHLAAKEGRAECLQILIDKGANLEATDSSGNTPLHFAAKEGRADCAQILIDKGANVEAADKCGRTPLHLAAQNGHANCLQVLIDNGANLEAIDMHGMTPLHCTADSGNADCLRMFIDKGANLESTGKNGMTPLHWAARAAKANSIKTLIDKGVNLETTNREGRTALHLAALADSADSLQILIDKGANLEAEDKDGKTALQISIDTESFSCVKALALLVPAPEDFVPFKATLANGKVVEISHMLEKITIFKSMNEDIDKEKLTLMPLDISEETWELLNKHLIDLFVLSHIEVAEKDDDEELTEAAEKLEELSERFTQTNSLEKLTQLLKAANYLEFNILLTITQSAYALVIRNAFIEGLNDIPKDLRGPVKAGLLAWLNKAA